MIPHFTLYTRMLWYLAPIYVETVPCLRSRPLLESLKEWFAPHSRLEHFKTAFDLRNICCRKAHHVFLAFFLSQQENYSGFSPIPQIQPFASFTNI